MRTGKRTGKRSGKQVCKFLPQGRNELAGYQLAGDKLQRKKKYLGVSVDNKLKKTQQNVLAEKEGNSTPGSRLADPGQ